MIKQFIADYGLWGLLGLSTGEQFILPIPSDPFLGLLKSNGTSIYAIMLVVFFGTILGATAGYFLGKKLGHPAIVWLFGERKVNRAEKSAKKWSMWGIIIAGLTPIPFQIFTWLAGAFEMSYRKFITAVLLGRMPRYLAMTYFGSMLIGYEIFAGENLKALILGAIQGITEFLPISSSGHLLIVEKFLQTPYSDAQMASFDIFLHGGSLLAIVIYFWKDWFQILKETGGMIRRFKIDTKSLTFKLAVATIPVIVAALLFGDFIKSYLREQPKTVAVFFILVGIMYFYTAWKSRWNFRRKIHLKKAILIGFAQALALIPGVSRAGSTIAAGVSMGIKREAAARFSFLLGGIAILAANVYELLSLWGGDVELPDLKFILTGTITSFLASLISIYLLLKFLKKYSMRAFGVYLILAGVAILSFGEIFPNLLS